MISTHMPARAPAAAPAQPESPADKAIRLLLNEHAALRAMLQSILLMLDRGPGDAPERFFDVLRAMLFYIDEFPEKLHHRKESELLFPAVLRWAPDLAPTISRLERDHAQGESQNRALQHALLGWEMLGESRAGAFAGAARDYIAAYFEHMHAEEAIVFPAARKVLAPADWAEIATAFSTHRDPFANPDDLGGTYDRLFTRIVTNAPAPIGVGKA
jgi:hemerythrin-like domain-containing protein